MATPPASIPAALRDLAAAGFEFEPDVHFTGDPYASCDGAACAHVLVMNDRRTVVIARESFTSRAALRAALLEVWERYRTPHAGSTRDLARGAWRVLADGPRVGVDDRALLRRTHHTYRALYEQLAPAERQGLPEPDALPFP